jgi:hypothetical protein
MTARPKLRRRLALGLIPLALVACLPFFNREVRSFALFRIAPAYARDAHFIRLVRREDSGTEQDIFLLGTIHGDHLRSTYSLWQIAALVENLKPDLLLVESRPDELARDNLADGPIEMLVASLTARSVGVRFDGIDWWQKADLKPGTSNPSREDHMFQNAQARLPDFQRVLILVGYSHVPELAGRLEKTGYARADFQRADKQRLFITKAPTTFTAGTEHYLRKRIDQIRDELATENDPAWQSALRASLAQREELLKLVAELGERQ